VALQRTQIIEFAPEPLEDGVVGDLASVAAPRLAMQTARDGRSTA